MRGYFFLFIYFLFIYIKRDDFDVKLIQFLAFFFFLKKKGFDLGILHIFQFSKIFSSGERIEIERSATFICCCICSRPDVSGMILMFYIYFHV